MSNFAKKYGGTIATTGFAFGTGGWGALAKAAGLMGISRLLSGSQRVKGAKLTELGIQLSQEGAELTRFWGNHRQGLNIVWPRGPALTEHKKTSTQGKGGQKVENYTYTATFVGLGGVGPITRLNRLVVGTRAFYDYNGGSEQGMTLTWDPAGFWYGEHDSGLEIAVYPGTLDQPVDSEVEAVEGVDQWTNYPGLWYIRFKNLPTNNGQLEPITVEVYNAVTGVSDIILEVAGWVGSTEDDFDLSAFDGLDVDRLEGEGFSADSRQPAAEIISELLDLFHAYLVEEDFVLRGKLRNAPAVKTLSAGELRIHSPGDQVPDTQFPQADEKTLPYILEGSARDPGRLYQVSHTSSPPRQNTGSRQIDSESWNANLRENQTRLLATIRQAQRWAGASTVNGSLGLENMLLSPGDAVGVPSENGTRDVLLQTVNYPLFGPIPFQAVERDLLAYSIPLPGDTEALNRQPPVAPGAPVTFVVETVPFAEARPDMVSKPGFLAGATVQDVYDWNTVDLNVDVDKGTGWVQRQDHDLRYQAIIGELLDDFTPTDPTAGHVAASTMSVKLFADELGSCVLTDAQQGANLAVFGTGLAFSFCNATLVGTDGNGRRTYTLDTIKCGGFTSDDFNVGAIAAGTYFMLLTNSDGQQEAGPRFLETSPSYRGYPMRFRAVLNSQTTTVMWSTFDAQNMTEPKPVIVTAERSGGVRLYGGCRTRYPGAGADFVSRVSAKLYSEGYKYRITLVSGATERTFERYTTDAQGSFDFTITDAELTTAFGSVPDAGDIDGTIASYGTYGPGRAREFEGI